jgi:hypothetical protein
MVTNAAINVISGRPVTPEGLLKSGISGGLGGVVGNLTDSSFLGGLTAVGANAALNKSLSPSSMSSAIPFAVSGTSRTSSQNTGYPSSSGYSGYPSSSGYSGYPSSSGYSGSSGMPNSNSQYSSDLFDPKTKLPKLPEASLFANKATDKQGGSHLQKLIQMNPQMASVSPDLLSKLTPSAQKLAMRAGGKVPQYKSGGLPHIPEFKTGATGHYVKGHGDGQSDDIPAMLADGEYVFDADTVAQLGNGSSDAGAKLLDHFRESLREHKRSAPSNKIPPKASPLTYMKEALKRHERK